MCSREANNGEGPVNGVDRPGLFAKRLLAGLLTIRLEKSPSRIRLAAFAFLAAYAIIAAKLIDFGLRPVAHHDDKGAASDTLAAARPDILDRNGKILATDVKVMSVFAEPRRIVDKDEAVELLTAVLPGVDARELRARLGSIAKLNHCRRTAGCCRCEGTAAKIRSVQSACCRAGNGR